MSLLINAEGISLSRRGRQILQQVDITLKAGKILTLIGPNGAGKTSLVRCLLGLTRPDTGHIRQTAGLRIGYMPQKIHLETSLPLTVSRFLALGGKPRLDLTEVAQMTGIDKLTGLPMQSLSGGETQRVLLARALLRDPQLLVLDEPVQGVDVSGQTALYRLIHEIRNRRGCGVLLVSHDLHLVMANSDTVVCLNQHVCCHGHPEQVTSDPAYLALFGDLPERDQQQIAIYTHHHDHQHDVHGKVIRPHVHGPHCEH
ncbi:zinc ABC transporter ATP-binding protein ZnuC [Cellvibrio japonicus]|nr:zinc ABC transporter ATP-binding protein ZnuC [Cellvibrio japonicus]QEI13710.1 zinc ABC transporter ATP-binding protein ZnuC [Cellvibrio japonicus]QEI17284.1 zinc ABC transporter ATP-binding protein ZnuC [Cellvibrio japonicus]QEI20861.1 zinc ABC transporter ATP-binding protein ZnuC [Cellvibrio japonicus]